VTQTRQSVLPLYLRRPARRLWRWLVSPASFQVVYHDRYDAAFPDVPNDPLRAERIIAFLASEGLILRRCINQPEPVWLKALELVHDAGYLDSIHDRAVLTSIFGVDVGAGQVDRVIDFQRLQTGGTLMATRRARSRGVGINLGGGFHHAAAERGGGFCLFNDVAVAIADERRRGFRGRVLVIDLDLHDGDGTRSIFADDPDVHTFSIHARDWGPTEAEASTSIELGSDVGDELYLAAVESHLPALVRSFRPQLIFYLAGCDPAATDVLGEWRISPAAMLERDRTVFELARGGHPKVPLVIVLAGGYGQEAWRYTARFLGGLDRKHPLEPPTTEEITLKRYRYLSSLLDPAELSGGGTGDDFGITEADVLLPGWGPTRETRFLGFYTRHGLELVLERAGFLDRLRDLGYRHPTLDLQLDDPGGQTLRIFGDPGLEELLVELRLRRDRRTLAGFELLSVEWLLMQNPRASFGRTRPRLPGQKHPGLGMLADVAALLSVACERLHLDGLVFVPSNYHVAAYGRGLLRFFKPSTRARFEALQELFDQAGIALPEATRAIAEGRVVNADTGEVFKWRPEPMLLPVSERLAERMEEVKAEMEMPVYRFHLLQKDPGGPEDPDRPEAE